MSKISLAPDASGTGIFTIASPNSNTNRTLTLPDDTGTIVTNSGNQAGSFTTLNTSGAVVFNDAGADVDFRVEGDTEANLLFVDASTDRVGIGTNTPASPFEVNGQIKTTDINAANLVGQVAAFAMDTPPTGWLVANGAAVSRTTYAELFAAIGTVWGSGDGSTTFNLPDLRASAPVGLGTSTGYSVNETVAIATKYNDQVGPWLGAVFGVIDGSVEADAIVTTGTNYGTCGNNRRFIGSSIGTNGFQWGGSCNNTNYLIAKGGEAVTRGKRVGVQYCIKF